MFKSKYFIFSDKNGKPYYFRTKHFSFLYSISSCLLILWVISFWVTLALIVMDFMSRVVFIIVLLCLFVIWIYDSFIFAVVLNYSVTVRLSYLIYEQTKKNSMIFYLPLTKVKYKGYKTILQEGKKRIEIPYLSKEIYDGLVKFLSEVGVTDLSQTKEPS